MLKDPTAFRKRFQAWKKTGESQYEAGIPKYNPGKDKDESKLFNYIDRATRYIAEHEGFVDHVYEDSFASQDYAKKNGYWSEKHKKYVLPTAGYGWTAKKDLRNWTKEEADKRLREDVVKYDNHGRKLIPNWDNFPAEHKMAIMDLFHQGGLWVLNKIPKFKAALLNGDPNAGKHISFASNQTKTRNSDRIALWNSSQQYRDKEFKSVAKSIAKEKAVRYEPIDFAAYRKPLMPVEKQFDFGVPEALSIKNTFDSQTQKAIKAIDNQIALSRLLKSISLESLNPWASVPQIGDIMGGRSFFQLSMPNIINQ